jgi:hypothetical protein
MRTAKRNWKTTLFGVLTLGLVGVQVYAAPGSAASAETLAKVSAGIGLICAKDGDKGDAAK